MKLSRTLATLAFASLSTFSYAAEIKTFSPDRKDMAQASAESKLHPEFIEAQAKAAYIWAYPMINMLNRRTTLGQVPSPGRLFGVLPAGPAGRIGMLNDYIDPGQNFIACPNQDVVYGLGFMDLDEGPVVIQIPEIGDRFWVYAIYDQRTDQIGHLGRQYNTRPGHYLLVGPNWNGETPVGIVDVIQSTTSIANVIPRLFMDDTDDDRAAIQPLINQIMTYPVSDYDGSMKTTNWSEAPSFGKATSGGETKWVRPEAFFDQLKVVLDTVPPIQGEGALYSQLKALVAAGERDPAVKKAITKAVSDSDNKLIPDFLKWEFNGKDVGNNWNLSQNNAEWGVDYYNRTATARSNMFENRASETCYFYTDYDSEREELEGDGLYTVTFAKGELPPVNGFWSLTLYNEHHFFAPNEMNRYSLGTKNKRLKFAEDGSLTLYVGNESPGKDLETNWIPAPDEEFSLYLRAYWPSEGILDGSWTPPKVVQIE